MSTISITKMYELLSAKVGKETAENLTSYIEEKIKNEFEDNLKVLSTKADLLNVRAELLEKIADTKSELIKWMFIFWIGQIAATFGFILLFLKK